jgi:hypothetical protein
MAKGFWQVRIERNTLGVISAIGLSNGPSSSWRILGPLLAGGLTVRETRNLLDLQGLWPIQRLRYFQKSQKLVSLGFSTIQSIESNPEMVPETPDETFYQLYIASPTFTGTRIQGGTFLSTQSF